MLTFNVVFSMFIFNVDFRCWFSMLFLMMIFAVFLLFFRLYFFHNIVSAEVIFLYFFNFYFLICRQILFYFLLLIFIAILFFLPFFLFRLLIFFVSFQFLFFSPQKLTYFTMIMLGHHTAVLLTIKRFSFNFLCWASCSRNHVITYQINTEKNQFNCFRSNILFFMLNSSLQCAKLWL